MNIPGLSEMAKGNMKARRQLEMIGNVKREDLETICFAMLDDMLAEGAMRTDRPMPTVKYQEKWIADMNDSDADWIERLAFYKKDIEIAFSDAIPLTDYQKSWFFYITGASQTKPEGNIEDKAEAELDDIKF